MRSWLLAACLVLVACSESDSVDKRKCTALRDHMIDLRLAGGHNTPGVDLAQHRAAMKQALGDQFIAQCEKSMKIDQLNCAMKATDVSASRECSRVAHTSSH